MFYELLTVDFEDLTVYVQNRTLSEDVKKTFKLVVFIVAFYIILNISKTVLKSVTEIKKSFMMSGKVGTSVNKMVYAKGTFLWWRLCILSFRTIAYIVNKQSSICRKYLPLQGLCVPSVKTTADVCNRFQINIFFFKFKWKVLKRINPNLGGLSRGSFLSPYYSKTTSLKTITSFEVS